MSRTKKPNEMQILQEFVNITRGREFDRNLNNIHNPIYGTLSQTLKLPKHVIRKVIFGMQPSLILQRYKPDSKSYIFETPMHHSDNMNKSETISGDSATKR